MIPVGDATELDFETLDAAIEAAGGAGGFCRQVANANVARTQNLAMIARDEPKHGSLAYCIGKWGNFPSFPPEPRLYGTLKQWKRVKPAITGLTTVHDGKARGLGFCSDGY